MADWLKTYTNQFSDGAKKPAAAPQAKRWDVADDPTAASLATLPYGLAEPGVQGAAIARRKAELQAEGERIGKPRTEVGAWSEAYDWVKEQKIGEQVSGGGIRTGPETAPRDVPFYDLQDQANIDLTTRAAEAQTRRQEKVGTTRFSGGFDARAGNVLDEPEEENIAFKNEYGTLSRPSTTEKVAGFVPGAIYGFAKEATKPITGEGAPPGEMPGVGLGETLAQAIGQAGETEEAPDLPEMVKPADNVWDYMGNVASSAWRETGELAKAPLTIATGLGNVYTRATRRTRPAEERGKELAQDIRNLGGAVTESFKRTFTDPVAALEQGPIEQVLNIAGVGSLAKGALASQGAKLTAAREAKAASAAVMAEGFESGALDAAEASAKWQQKMAAQTAKEAALEDVITSTRAERALRGLDPEGGQTFAAQRQALNESRAEVLRQAPTVDAAKAAQQAKIAREAAEALQTPGRLERLLTPEATRTAALQAERAKASKAAADTGVAASRTLQDTAEWEKHVAKVRKLDEQLKKSKQYGTLQKIVARTPMYVGTLGGAAVTDLVGHAVARSLNAPGRAVGRWLAYSKNNAIPPEALALRREAATAVRGDTMVLQDLVAGIPVDKRPSVRALLHMDAEAGGVYDRIRWDNDAGTWVAKTAEDAADPAVQGMLRVAETYAKPLAERVKATVDDADRLGVPVPDSLRLKIQEMDEFGGLTQTGPGWFDLYPEKPAIPDYVPGRAARVAAQGDTAIGVEQAQKAKIAERSARTQDDVLLRETDLAKEVTDGLAKLRFEVRQAEMYKQMAADPNLVLSPDDFVKRRAQAAYEEYGNPESPLKTSIDKTYRKVSETDMDMGALRGKYVNEDVLMDIRNTREAALAAQSWFARGMGKVKRTLTQWNPGTHQRNVLTSALVMAPMAGNALWDVRSLPHYAQALTDMAGNAPSKMYREAIKDGVFAGNASLDLGGATSTKGTRYQPRKDLARRDPRNEKWTKESVVLLDDIFGTALNSPTEAMQALMTLAHETRLPKAEVMRRAKELGATAAQAKKAAANVRGAKNDSVVKTFVKNSAWGLDKYPGLLYNAEDDWFRLALYYRKRAEGMSGPDAADFARKAYVDFENTSGAVQVLRTPTTIVRPGGQRITGTQVVPLIVSQPFIAYPAQATRIYAEWAKREPWKAAILSPLLDILTDINYSESGYTKEEAETMMGLGRKGPKPDLLEATLGKGISEDLFGKSEVPRGINTRFLNPIGSFEPQEEDDVWSYMGRALGIGGSNVLVGPALNMAQNYDPFRKEPIVTSDDPVRSIEQGAEYLMGSYAPTIMPSPTDQLGLTQGPGAPSNIPRIPGGRLAEKVAREGAGIPDATGRVPERALSRAIAQVSERDPALGMRYALMDLDRAASTERAAILQQSGYAKAADVPEELQSQIEDAWVKSMMPRVARLAADVAKLPEGVPGKATLSMYLDILQDIDSPEMWKELYDEMRAEVKNELEPQEELEQIDTLEAQRKRNEMLEVQRSRERMVQ